MPEKYHILQRLGRGGSSEVYLVEDTALHKLWAMKRVKKEQPCLTRQYIKEAELMKCWNHPFLPRIVDVCDDGEFLCIVMDYVEGETLKTMLSKEGVFSEKQVAQWAVQLASVLSYLHGQEPPVIYRDMKPENVMVTREGFVKLIDFGVSRRFVKERHSDTECLGTVGYAAPEQYGGHGQTDERTDIYGLGIVLYELLGGKNLKEPPYEVVPVRQLRPEISRGMERIIWKCTRPNPESRYQSCQELIDALNRPEPEQKIVVRKIFRSLFIAALSFVAGYAAAHCGL